MLCHHCKTPQPPVEKLPFRDSCPKCHRDLHVCLNCFFHDRSAYNECREPAADRVTDKEGANFCEYFQPAVEVASGTVSAVDPAAEAKQKLAAMFKKK